MTSRLANYFPDRFTGFAFLAVGYSPPNPDLDIAQICQATKQALGYELLGYWYFAGEEGADVIIENHVSVTSFL